MRAGIPILVLLIATLPLVAQSPTVTSSPTSAVPQSAVVKYTVQFRAGPALSHPSCGELKKGDQVVVLRQDGDWCAIAPPTGCKSWINHRFLDPSQLTGKFPANVAVCGAEGADVRAGNVDGSGPTESRTLRLPKGAIVEVIGQKIQTEIDKSFWFPISAPQGDYRWVTKSALEKFEIVPEKPPQVVSGRDMKVDAKIDPPRISVTPGMKDPPQLADAGWPQTHPRWAVAERAERDGDYAKAEAEYLTVYQDMQKAQADRESQLIAYGRFCRCQDRLKLEGQKRVGGTPPPPPPVRKNP